MASVCGKQGRPKTTKWESVFNRILDEINEQRLLPGARFHTVRELAVKYGVSLITAQRVFQELGARHLIVTNGGAGSVVAGASTAQTVYLCLRNEHLAESHQRIGFVTGDPRSVGYRSRLQGYLDGMLDHGFAFKPEWIRITDVSDRAAELLWKRSRGALKTPVRLRIEPKLIVRTSTVSRVYDRQKGA